MIGVDIRNEYSNIAEYDKAAKIKLKIIAGAMAINWILKCRMI